ncbi:alpha-L-fucosidase [Chitinophaga terrae (ex Kim and Jung 2007)]|uniref:alpha-L-fucosidase n=1 Tax=Chitinophaga terrae (ex Kim and Jung 2007) TaxID=408074 RepID=A0A1H4EQD0_9BACT|nr:alpha-L-fucosidase [Chitinophaga terrae (ex Kim and Jung 2007)]SEA86838.1 alpha-L-fucosidase [Chitinophaga terrae (ex Kim and Jung 2007)]
MNRKRTIVILLSLVLLLNGALAQAPTAKTEWQDQKYSMFIHWGAIYSTLGGVWEGKPVTRGYSEQIQSHAGIYSDVYAAVAKRFNPANWNADSIVLLAKAAGMKSVVMTSKHHDGFCMFHSAYTDYNVVDATPFKRDVLKELSEACRRHGLKFGMYFSLIDWHFPQAYPISSSNSDPITPEHHEFNKKQVTELMTNYGPVSEIWFDMGSLTEQQSRDLADIVHRLQPGCMVSGRLGNDAGDFCVMGDNQYPDYKIASPWQTPASVYDETWGYRSWQKHGPVADKAHEKLIGLIKVVSRGGNYLLNIGPRGDGSVVDFERDVLLANGQWLQQNGEAIYGTTANPFDTTFSWGEVTAKPGKLYLHLLSKPGNNRIILPGLTSTVSKAAVLGGSKAIKIKTSKQGNNTIVQLPVDFNPADKEIPVVALSFNQGVQITPLHLIRNAAVLNRFNAVPLYSFSGSDYESYYRSQVGNSWTFTAAGSADLQLRYSEEEKGKTIRLSLNGQSHEIALNNGKVSTLDNHPESLAWGPMYSSGPYWSGIDGAHGDLHNIDPSRPWPDAGGSTWTRHDDWKNDALIPLSDDRTSALYILQEITAPEAGDYLVGFTSGDGIAVFLNGEEQIVHNNPERGETQREVLLLPLKAGKNQLVVKYYNRFAKAPVVGINRNIPQVMYTQPLSVNLPAQPVKAELREARPVSPHRNLRMPNLAVLIDSK